MTFIQLKRKRRGGERERGREEKERRESVSVSEIGISLPIPANHTPALLAPIPSANHMLVPSPLSISLPYLYQRLVLGTSTYVPPYLNLEPLSDSSLISDFIAFLAFCIQLYIVFFENVYILYMLYRLYMLVLMPPLHNNEDGILVSSFSLPICFPSSISKVAECTYYRVCKPQLHLQDGEQERTCECCKEVSCS